MKSSERQEIVFIDSAVKDPSILANGVEQG